MVNWVSGSTINRSTAVERSGDGLPEDCIVTALSLTNPKDACRLSIIGSMFRSAAQSDIVWERFLPSDYRSIVSRSVEGGDSLMERFHSKKDLYFYLCDHSILIDDGLKSFRLEKSSGKKCYMVAAKDLSIIWGDTVQYWQWISIPESRFAESAELVNVCWLEIHGSISTKMLSPETNYAAYLVFKTASRVYGFDRLPVKASVGTRSSEKAKRAIYLDPENAQRQNFDTVLRRSIGLHFLRRRENVPMDVNVKELKLREDGWKEVELGEYFVKGDEEDDLEISLMEVDGGHWKSGIIIQGIEIRPKNSM